MAGDDRSLYVVLGVTERSTASEIRIAYLNLARALHPDRQQGRSPAERSLAERRMREVNDAYAVLSDATKRTGYDRERRAARTARAATARTATTGARPADPRPAGTTTRSTGTGTRPPGPRPENPERFDADPAWRRHLSDDDDLDDVELSPVVAFLMRRGPLLAVLALAAILFIGTAYAGPSDDAETPATTTSAPCSPSIVTGVSGGSVVPEPC